VFNQDKSQFAVLWKKGGFTKYDTKTMMPLQTIDIGVVKCLGLIHKANQYYAVTEDSQKEVGFYEDEKV